MLHRLQERGITIVVSTPFMDEARQCNRIAFLQHGHVQGIDTPEIILEKFKDILCPPGLEHDTPTKKHKLLSGWNNWLKHSGVSLPLTISRSKSSEERFSDFWVPMELERQPPCVYSAG